MWCFDACWCDGAGARALFETMRSAIDAGGRIGGELAQYATDLEQTIARWQSVTATLTAADDVAVRTANASMYLEAVGHVVLAGHGGLGIVDRLLRVFGKAGARVAERVPVPALRVRRGRRSVRARRWRRARTPCAAKT